VRTIADKRTGATTGFAASEGGLRSWLAARWTRASALYFAAPPSCGCFAGVARALNER
jgi:hypothetical protein